MPLAVLTGLFRADTDHRKFSHCASPVCRWSVSIKSASVTLSRALKLDESIPRASARRFRSRFRFARMACSEVSAISSENRSSPSVLAHTGAACIARFQCFSRSRRKTGESTPAPASAAKGPNCASTSASGSALVIVEGVLPQAPSETEKAIRIAARASLIMPPVYPGAASSATLRKP